MNVLLEHCFLCFYAMRHLASDIFITYHVRLQHIDLTLDDVGVGYFHMI